MTEQIDRRASLEAIGRAYEHLCTSNPTAWQAFKDDLERVLLGMASPDHQTGAGLLLNHIRRRESLTRILRENGTTPKRAKTSLGATNG